MAITPVQSVITTNANTNSTLVNSFSVTLSAITAGNTIVGGFEFLGGVGTIVDNAGSPNTYNKSAVVTQTTDGNNFVMFYLQNIPAGGPTVITANFNGTNQLQFARFVVTEFSGVAITSPLDVGFGGPTQNTGVVGTATFSAADVTTLVAGDLIYCASCQTNASTGITLGVNYTALAYGANTDVVPMRAEYRIQAAAGSVNTGNAQFAGISGTNNYLTGMIPLKAAAASACPHSLALTGVGCGIWAAKKIEENPILTRRSLLLPANRSLLLPRRRSMMGHNGGPPLDD